MSKFDLVVFGATGFTGKHAVVEVAKVARKHGLTWAVAGRSQAKLQAIMEEASKKFGEDLSSIKKLIADVADEKSLKEMCSQAKVVINCCGPYRLYGEPVVKAAIDCKADYVDVTGEPQFMETMQLEYGKAAQDAGVYIIHACGFDSIPNDMGLIYMEQNFDGTLNSAESYLTAGVPADLSDDIRKHGAINYGTYESLVYGLTHYSELGPLRKKLFPQRLPNFQPKLAARGIHSRFGKWNVPFLGSDQSVVYRTQRQLYEAEHKRPVQFKPYVRLGGVGTLLGALAGGLIFYLMCMTSFTRKLLLNHPRFFSLGYVSREGPTPRVMESSYFKMELYGSGWARGEDEGNKPNKNIRVKVSGSNPGYGSTVVALVYSAFTLLTQKDKVPGTGGVITTGVAFRNTDLIKHLNENGLKFEVLQSEDK